MPSRKAFDESGGILQRAKIVRCHLVALANADGCANGGAAGADGGADGGALANMDSDGANRPTLDSESVFHWLQKWSWGKMSSIEVQKEALRSHNDNQRTLHSIPVNEDYMPTSIHTLAQLGNWGAQPGNVNRDLKLWLGEPTIPTAKMVTVPLAVQKPATGESMTKDIKFPILLPHEIISHVYHTQPTLFSGLYIGDDSGVEDIGTWERTLEEFWTTVDARKDPRLLNHPMKTTAHWKKVCASFFAWGCSASDKDWQGRFKVHGCLQHLWVAWRRHHKGFEIVHFWLVHHF